jgi:hypothetical protein
MKLRPGRGAKASLLTKFVQPRTARPLTNDPKHRTQVVVAGHFQDEKERLCFKLWYPNQVGDVPHLYALRRWIKITEEGPPEDLFDEEQIAWADSEARQLLYKELSTETIPLRSANGDLKSDANEIFKKHPCFKKYDEEKFPDRLAALRSIVIKAKSRALDDKKAFESFCAKHTVSHSTHQGYSQWKSSKARKIALEDIKNNLHQEIGYRNLFRKRIEYHENFDFSYWRDRIKQEIKNAKYMHTLKINSGKKLVLDD